MKLTAVASVPAPKKGLLTAYLLTPQNLKTVRAAIQKSHELDPGFDESAGDAGSVQMYSTGTTRLLFCGLGAESELTAEGLRRAACGIVNRCNEMKASTLALAWIPAKGKAAAADLTALTESIALSNYQYLTFKSQPVANALTEARILAGDAAGKAAVEKGRILAEVTSIARDLVNEPVITLTAEEMSARAVALGKKYGFKAEILNKNKIQALKMGGLLAVNTGSPLPPTFSILEYKPAKPRNKKPVVLVGKGVVFDTGGLSLKETPGSMDSMKSDMAGAAAVIGTLCGAAALGLDVHLVGLIPATDNRPGGNAYTPGDVITIMDGTTVEVLNTDAEGRLILADALVYAQKYKPELVVDLATLTGAAVIGVGHIATAMMSTAAPKVNTALKASGDRTYERLIELPLWDEYKDQLRSDIADMKNIGGKPAGSITAGKFLQHFTDYPWVHLDIAGPAFLPGTDSYRGRNGTGVGVRLLLDFLENY